MICQNCGKREANVKYTQIINGVKKEINVCEECSRELGIEREAFNMPLSFSSILGDMFAGVLSGNTMPDYMKSKNACTICKTDIDEFLDTGLLGCPNCYTDIGDRLDAILKRIQGADRHVGRKAKNHGEIISKNLTNIIKEDMGDSNKREEETVQEKIHEKGKIVEKKEEVKEENKLEKLNKELEKAIKDERYEDAAKIRDEIKKLNS